MLKGTIYVSPDNREARLIAQNPTSCDPGYPLRLIRSGWKIYATTADMSDLDNLRANGYLALWYD